MIMHWTASELLIAGKLYVNTNKSEGDSSRLHREARRTVVLLCCQDLVDDEVRQVDFNFSVHRSAVVG